MLQIDGVISSNGILSVPIKIIGSQRQALFWGVVDTGFTAYLSLPIIGVELPENCKIAIDYPARQFVSTE
jgi:predicted aspartyl protease